ncbi:hypothetical protein DVK05_13905 [Halorubrum sp. Atlit-8R]|uniref:hypothetical protein n=1 Tax=unclassified Halorubrum TaxID=2642239 RepID=UPI000EF180FA|nr:MULTISPECIES: hypothetical protein [unclassified Halorubrum]RLM63995.1 hypothetical protein DVK08_15650 [Halorubrum sp. Atlit-9R]RLM77372.1 hypothetical protein DVK05_13905 [Halorubrum sp. Atlit-8R]
MRCSRRSALRLFGVAGATAATAGCLNAGDLDAYSLIADELDLSSIERPYLWPDPTEIDAVTRVDFATEAKAAWLSELFDTGSVTVRQWPLVGRDRWGTETRPRPTFLRRDGTFYEVDIVDERIRRRDRWHFALERVDESPPDDATVAAPPFGLADQDERVLDAALDAVYAGHDGFLGDPEFDELQTVEFHHGLDADASELVPSPSFDFVDYEGEYFRAVAERRTVDVPEWTYAITELSDSRREFAAHARDAIVERDLDDAGLSEAAAGVLDDAIAEEPRRYEEGAPPSAELTEALDALAIADDLEPIDGYDERVDFRNVVVEYRDGVYRFDLIVTP